MHISYHSAKLQLTTSLGARSWNIFISAVDPIQEITKNNGFFIDTRPKPVGHGYVFSMAVGTIGEWLKLFPFFVRGRTVDSEGGVGAGIF